MQEAKYIYNRPPPVFLEATVNAVRTNSKYPFCYSSLIRVASLTPLALNLSWRAWNHSLALSSGLVSSSVYHDFTYFPKELHLWPVVHLPIRTTGDSLSQRVSVGQHLHAQPHIRVVTFSRLRSGVSCKLWAAKLPIMG